MKFFNRLIRKTAQIDAPTRGRELKYLLQKGRYKGRRTPPTRGRELKSQRWESYLDILRDAPHAGARIEIRRRTTTATRAPTDAPHAGARIEIHDSKSAPARPADPPCRGNMEDQIHHIAESPFNIAVWQLMAVYALLMFRVELTLRREGASNVSVRTLTQHAQRGSMAARCL